MRHEAGSAETEYTEKISKSSLCVDHAFRSLFGSGVLSDGVFVQWFLSEIHSSQDEVTDRNVRKYVLIFDHSPTLSLLSSFNRNNESITGV